MQRIMCHIQNICATKAIFKHFQYRVVTTPFSQQKRVNTFGRIVPPPSRCLFDNYVNKCSVWLFSMRYELLYYNNSYRVNFI